MKDKFKKIITATLISAASLSIIGCGTPNSKLAKNIDKGMNDFVSSINKLDYVDATNKSNSSIGKIVETASIVNTLDNQYLTKTLEELEQENPITLPNERTDNFQLFVLSQTPYILLTTNDNNASLSMQLNFSTEKIAETSNDINTKINNLILQRSILMVYVNEIYNNRVNLTEENRVAINAYVNVIKENASFLNGNRGMVRNQLTLANDLISNNLNNNLVNYYIIKSGEALETRSSKIDSSLSAIKSIIDIIETNLDQSSIFYNTKLSSTYNDLISNMNNNSQITSTENKQLADNISNSLNIRDYNLINNTNSESTIYNNQASTKSLNNKTIINCTDCDNKNKICIDCEDPNSNNLTNTNSRIINKETNKETINNANKNSFINNKLKNNGKEKLLSNQNEKNAILNNNNRKNTQINQIEAKTLELNKENTDNNNYVSNKELNVNNYENKTFYNNRLKNNHSQEQVKRVPYIRSID